MRNTTAIILKGCCKISDFYNLGRSPTDQRMSEATRGGEKTLWYLKYCAVYYQNLTETRNPGWKSLAPRVQNLCFKFSFFYFIFDLWPSASNLN